MHYFAMARLLCRFAQLPQVRDFVLKGALMMHCWGGSLGRATKDIDLMRRSSASVDELIDLMKRCVSLDVPDDGMAFHPEGVVGEEIR